MKKKLLFLTVAFDTGGTEKVTLDIINNINPEKYDITLMTMYNGGLYQSKLKPYIKVKYFFPKFIRYVIRYVTTFPRALVYKTFIKDKYDVEIACGDDIPSRVIGGSSNKKSKKIAWIHMDVAKRGYRGYEMKSRQGRYNFYKNFDRIVNVSRECKDKFIEKFGFGEKVIVIHNPLPIDEIISKSKENTRIRLRKDEFNIVVIGRLTEQKGYDRLLEVHKRLIRENFKHNIYIIGDGVDRQALEKFTMDNNLSDSVTFLGFLENPYPVLKQASLFVVSSRDESYCLVLAEAMILGIPVMSTRCTGPTELLDNGKNGLLVDNSKEGIYQGLKNILSDKDIYYNLKEKAENNIHRFDFKKQIEAVEALLDEG